jgi:hypothetical protein
MMLTSIAGEFSIDEIISIMVPPGLITDATVADKEL